ncbi:MAG TPA: gamma-glutamyl-gamma-aminobutyrate hydrolase family protein [Alphaproteobacteria bacterium]|nr:gamma-glutamyl-gamma-aminobutyrate hydrolase family protein [Alphaproteobacteria bacterium]
MVESEPLRLVGLPACVKEINEHPFHACNERYLTAVVVAAEAVPLIIPALGDSCALTALVGRLDGLLLTGSPSNVEPHHYEGPASVAGTKHDPFRDATTLPLIREAVRAGLPLLAICRGIQELNVALGGTLHQRVQELPGKMDHRMPQGQPREIQYGPRHPVRLTPGGFLAGLAGTTEIMVNSLHAQAIDRPAQRLVIEALSPDGVIEAVRVADAPAFAVGVQWHPEWRVMENPVSRALFAAFGAAVRARAEARRSGRLAGLAA